jgi:hypothetical protein
VFLIRINWSAVTVIIKINNKPRINITEGTFVLYMLIAYLMGLITGVYWLWKYFN